MRQLIRAPYIDQTADWPTGCESVSTVMLLAYLGIGISVAEFVDRYLERRPMHWERAALSEACTAAVRKEPDGAVKLLVGPDPRKYFAGDPRDPQGFGCYAPVIRRAMERVLTARRGGDAEAAVRDAGPAAGIAETDVPRAADAYAPAGSPGEGDRRRSLQTVDLTGVPLSVLLAEYIDRGFPVIFWATLDLQEPEPGPDWLIEGTGEVFHWISHEHCMLLVGYDDEEGVLIFNDPWMDHGTVAYDRELVWKRHLEEHAMAVSLRRCSA